MGGGGWCTTQKECYEWVKDGAEEAGSDTLSNTTSMSGIHSIDPDINPMFFQWNQVFVNYCDGGSYMGDLDEPYWFDGVQVHVKGSRIVPAVMTYLNDNFEFHAATDVLFGGESSGALGAMLNANKAGELVKGYTDGNAEFRVLSDAGWFLDVPNYENGNYTSEWFKHIVEMRNMTSQFDKSCRNSMSENHVWKCFLPYYNFPHIEAPVFLIQSDLDIYQLETFYFNDVEAGVHCVENPMSNCTPDLFAATDRFRGMFKKHMDLPRKTPSTGIFLDSCFAHVQTKSNNHWNNPLVQGVTMAEVIQHWYFQEKDVNEPKTYKYEDKKPWPHVHQSCDTAINFSAWYDMDLKKGLWKDDATNDSWPPPQVLVSDPSVGR